MNAAPPCPRCHSRKCRCLPCPKCGTLAPGMRAATAPRVYRYTAQICERCEAAEYLAALEQHNAAQTKCPHGRTHGACSACDIAADYAFDSAREREYFKR